MKVNPAGFWMLLLWGCSVGLTDSATSTKAPLVVQDGSLGFGSNTSSKNAGNKENGLAEQVQNEYRRQLQGAVCGVAEKDNRELCTAKLTKMKDLKGKAQKLKVSNEAKTCICNKEVRKEVVNFVKSLKNISSPIDDADKAKDMKEFQQFKECLRSSKKEKPKKVVNSK